MDALPEISLPDISSADDLVKECGATATKEIKLLAEAVGQHQAISPDNNLREELKLPPVTMPDTGLRAEALREVVTSRKAVLHTVVYHYLKKRFMPAEDFAHSNANFIAQHEIFQSMKADDPSYEATKQTLLQENKRLGQLKLASDAREAEIRELAITVRNILVADAVMQGQELAKPQLQEKIDGMPVTSHGFTARNAQPSKRSPAVSA